MNLIDIGDIGAEIIAYGLQKSTSVETLNISNILPFYAFKMEQYLIYIIVFCKIAEKGIIALGAALQNHSNLKILYLGNIITMIYDDICR